MTTITTLTVPLPRLHLKVKMPRLYPLRLRVVAKIIAFAGWVAGDALDIEIEGTDARPS